MDNVMTAAPGRAGDARPKHMAQTEQRFPLVLRIFGVLLLLSSIGSIVTNVVTLFIMGILTFQGVLLEGLSVATIVISIVYVVFLLGAAVGKFVLGVRLIRDRRRGVALACKVLGGVEAACIVCNFMLMGLSADAFSSVISIVLLAVLQAYADPTLRQERLDERRRQQLADKVSQEAGTLGLDETGAGYIRLDFFNIFWVFVVCCVIGLVLEIIWHMIVVDPGVYEDRAGLLYGPFSPIYGFGAVLITIALNRFYKSNPVIIFLAAGVIGAAFEYFVSWWMEFSFGITAWDYTGTFLNIGGRTNFMFFCIWGALGIVWLRWILPLLLKIINRIPWNWRYSVTAVAFALMLVDCVLTVAAFDCWNERMSGEMYEKQESALDVFCNEHYPNSYMEHRFQSMTMNPDATTHLEQPPSA